MIQVYQGRSSQKGDEMGYRVKDWEKLKHFKDRNAPWVKLNKDLLNNRDWFDLSADTTKTLVMLWLVASEDPEREGNLPDERELAFRLRMDVAELRKHLDKLGKWLEKSDTGVETDETTVVHTDNNEISQEPPKYDTQTTAVKKPRQKKSAGKKKYAKHSYSGEFEEFWALYPNNQHKKNAARKFEEIIKTIPAKEIIAGLQRQLEYSHFKEDPTHFNYAETWLNQRRWEKKAPKVDKESGQR